ncbi:hypothetical protein E2C01_089699 [Portunus trituberculatus]|uniref:Uncharacterized protein n=1 Tax=Portunus trituberculatus TaxID=210409 RepID=A0A5B7JJT1_PORTR|nr:hypothetical protein [Portunus trituberculatus]
MTGSGRRNRKQISTCMVLSYDQKWAESVGLSGPLPTCQCQVPGFSFRSGDRKSYRLWGDRMIYFSFMATSGA